MDALFSTSASAPTMPTNYTLKRRIGSIIRSSAAIVPFKQDGDRFRLVTPVTSGATSNPGTSARTETMTLVPAGIAVLANFIVSLNNGTSTQIYYRASALDEANIAGPQYWESQLTCGDNIGTGEQRAVELYVKTNTSAQIRGRQSASGASDDITYTTLGWVDTRGRLA